MLLFQIPNLSLVRSQAFEIGSKLLINLSLLLTLADTKLDKDCEEEVIKEETNKKHHSKDKHWQSLVDSERHIVVSNDWI